MDRQALDRRSPLPLWAQLHAELRRRLASGEFAAEFPGELELAAEYGVSRNTVREALRELRADGTVVAERGRRPRVSSEIRQRVGSAYSLHDTLEAAGLARRSVVRVRETTTDAAAAAELGGPADLPLLHLERLRIADGRPLAIDRIWLPLELAAPLLEADLERHGFYEELARRTGLSLTGGREHVRAVTLRRDERADLAAPAGTAAFAIDRLGMCGARAIEWRRTLIRADRFSLVADLSPVGTTARGQLEELAAGHP